jgi:hypothetical protein
MMSSKYWGRNLLFLIPKLKQQHIVIGIISSMKITSSLRSLVIGMLALPSHFHCCCFVDNVTFIVITIRRHYRFGPTHLMI